VSTGHKQSQQKENTESGGNSAQKPPDLVVNLDATKNHDIVGAKGSFCGQNPSNEIHH
jgi:hypothetical protein